MDELEPKRLYRAEWRSRIPYPVRFDFAVSESVAPVRMFGHATGELAGTGEWRLFEQDDLTAVTYDWRVSTTKRWMNAIAPFARPVFAANHDYVMRGGGVALARRLRAELVAEG
jgi:hypothetical protein